MPLLIVRKHKLGLPFSPRNLRIKFDTNPPIIFLVIVVTDRHTQTDTQTNAGKTYSLAFAGKTSKRKNTCTPVKGINVYPHMPILRPHDAGYIANVVKFHKRRISSAKFTSAHLYGNVYIRMGGRGSRDGRFIRFWVSGGAKFTKICDSLP